MVLALLLLVFWRRVDYEDFVPDPLPCELERDKEWGLWS